MVELTSSQAVAPRPHTRVRPVSRSTTHREPGPFVALAEPTTWSIVLIGSVVLGVALSQSSTLATAHLALTILVVVGTALFANSPATILAVTVYAGTCDVMWRAAGATGPYEAGKYALVAGFGLLAVRFLRRPRNLGWCIAVLALLVPGAVTGVAVFGLGGAREYLVANLGGIIAIALGVLVCSNLRTTRAEMRGIYLLALSPAVSMAAIATTATIAAGAIDFGDQSNFVAAGGFGPVQVSAQLSFGALLCLLVVLQPRLGWYQRALAMVFATWLVGQALLTFSRGGIFSLVVALACAGLVALTVAGYRARTVVGAGVMIVLAIFTLSWVGAFTGDASNERFSSTDTTNRGEIAKGDLRLFGAHPLGGVGVGVAAIERDFSVRAIPHTEYTRLLAEHGIAGLGVLVLLAVMIGRTLRSATSWFRVAAVGQLAMALGEMSHSATRIGCIALGFALAALREEPAPPRQDAAKAIA